MRYSIGEDAILVGQFSPGSVVTIKIIVLDNDNLLVLDNINCYESTNMPGIFMWNTNNISDTNNINGYINLLYEMTNTEDEKYYGKIVYGGYPDDNTDVAVEDAHAKILEWLYILNGRI